MCSFFPVSIILQLRGPKRKMEMGPFPALYCHFSYWMEQFVDGFRSNEERRKLFPEDFMLPFSAVKKAGKTRVSGPRSALFEMPSACSRNFFAWMAAP